MSMNYDIEGFDRHIEKMFRESGIPGLAMTLRGPEGIIYDRAFGRRSIRRDLPLRTDTVMGLASMSKSLTSFALAILQAEGRFDFDDPVVKWIPEFRVPGTPPSMVKVKHLAMHTAGIPPIQPLEWSISMNTPGRRTEWDRAMRKSAPNRMDRIEQVVDYIAGGDYGRPGYGTLGQPGEYMSYSNEGYAVLSYIVDKAAGMPLERFLRERVFGPLGMSRTVLDVDAGEAKKLAEGNITSLFERVGGKLTEDDDWSVLPPFRGCACVKSTSGDISKYYKLLADRGVWEGKQAVPAEAVEILIGRAFPAARWPFYCYGLKKRLFAGRVICEHSGGLHGVAAAGGLVEGGYSAVSLTNEGSAEAEPFQWAAYNLILGLPLDTDQYRAVPVDYGFSDPEALAGDYLAEEGEEQHNIVRVEGGRLKACYCGRELELIYCGGAAFIARDPARPGQNVNTMEFLLRGGRAWGVRCGTRIYQKTD